MSATHYLPPVRRFSSGAVWLGIHAVPFFRRRVRAGSALLAFGAAMGGASGCALELDECTPGTAICEGGVARVCVASEYGARGHLWSSRDCGEHACVALDDASGRGEAFCALAHAADPRCTEAEGSSCDGEQLVSCHAGRALNVMTCEKGCVRLDDLPDYCRESPPDHARCVSGEGCELAGPSFSATSAFAPGASCNATTFGPAPEPDSHIYAYRCEGGLLTARHRCTSACVSTSECKSHCD